MDLDGEWSSDDDLPRSRLLNERKDVTLTDSAVDTLEDEELKSIFNIPTWVDVDFPAPDTTFLGD